MTSQTDLTLHITCLNPPGVPDDPRVVFGLQDKPQQLTRGQMRPDRSIMFTVPIKVKGTPGIASPDFAGPFVHGTTQQRFVYLSLGTQQGNVWHWIRRIKVPLSGITWPHIEEAGSKSGILEAALDGTGSGTVRLLGAGWGVKEIAPSPDQSQREQIISEAKHYWDQGLALDAGMIIFERISLEDRPLWAADIVELVYRDRATPPEVTAALDFARQPEQWPQSRRAEAHHIFGALKDLQIDDGSIDDDILGIAEHAAGITYTARQYPAPFDHNRGWRIVAVLYDIVKRLSLDESEAWQIVANERYITLGAPVSCHPGCPVCIFASVEIFMKGR